MSAAGAEVQCSSDTDHGEQYLWKSLVEVAVVKMPSFTVVIGEARIGGGSSHLGVQQSGPGLWIAFIDD